MTDLTALALQAGFSHVARLKTAQLKVMPEVREMCAAGRCQRYRHSWSCPPACGTLEEIEANIQQYSGGILVQSVGIMEDDFDIEAINQTQTLHKSRFFTLARQVRCLQPDCLPLTAGSCTICRRCTYPDHPCRFPSKMLSSMEAYGLLVSDVCLSSGLQYYYGPRAITFTSCILTKEGL